MSAVLCGPAAVSQCQHTDNCPACGTSSAAAQHAWKIVNARGETEWLKCSRCRAYFMIGKYCMDTETAHTQQMIWGDSALGERLNETKSRMYQAILAELRKHLIAAHCTLLDVGCSFGGFMKAAREEGFEVCGFDIVPEAVDRVTRAGMTAQCCGRVRDFTAQTRLFDVITVMDANFYWPDQPAELSDIYNRLKPGGLLVMRIADKSWMASIGVSVLKLSTRNGYRVLRRAVNDHRFLMPIGSFLRLLVDTGFRVLNASPKGAIQSDQTSLPVKMTFLIGNALWRTFGVFVSPGAIVVAERPK